MLEQKLIDKYFKFRDCGDDFLFEVGEQRYYIAKDLCIPKRCPSCRTVKHLLHLDNGGKDMIVGTKTTYEEDK